MKNLIFILAVAFSSSVFASNDAVNAQLSFRDLEAANKSALVLSISNAITAHYQTLSANEQLGVGMGCTVGRMVNQIKNAKTIHVNDEAGVIVAQVDYQPHVIKGPTRYTVYINYTPGTQDIAKVTIIATSKKGYKSSCSTRDGLIRYFSELNSLVNAD